MSALMEAKGVTFAYGGTPVLCDVKLSLDRGQVVALIGPNGSGKSTLIRVAGGQLRSCGAVLWEGRPVVRWKRRELARLAAYLPQSPAWEPEQTVREVVMLGRTAYLGAFGIESARDVTVADDVLSRLALTGLAGRRMDELSGGQRQRVFVARCLAQEPAAMLLDEPNTFLDLRHQVELGRLLRELARERNIAVLMASHELNLAGAFADRMVLLHEGRVAAQGSVGQVMRPEVLAPVYGVEMSRVETPEGAVSVVPVVK
jgi:iron complex transport system ATP-binding protein